MGLYSSTVMSNDTAECSTQLTKYSEYCPAMSFAIVFEYTKSCPSSVV